MNGIVCPKVLAKQMRRQHRRARSLGALLKGKRLSLSLPVLVIAAIGDCLSEAKRGGTDMPSARNAEEC